MNESIKAQTIRTEKIRAKLIGAVKRDLMSIALINERKVAKVFGFLNAVHERGSTRLTGACFGLGNFGMALAKSKMSPNICLSQYSHITYPIHWTELNQDYMECLCVLANTEPSGGTAIYKAVCNFLREFQRSAEAIRPWMIFIIADGCDDHSTAKEEALALTQLTLLHSVQGLRVELNFLTMNDSREDYKLARAGCIVSKLTNPLQIGEIIARAVTHTSRPWPDIGILIDTSGSMGTRV